MEEFDFEEDTEGADHSKYCWSNSAYAMAVNINRAFKLYGWCFADPWGRERWHGRGFADPYVSHGRWRRGHEMSHRNRHYRPQGSRVGQERIDAAFTLEEYRLCCVFVGAQSLHSPAEFDDPDATANANLGARLPYLFATCRFAHYLKCIVRDKVGSFAERNEVETWLNNWIIQICHHGPDRFG